MWQKLIDLAKQLLSITEKQQKHEEDIKEIRLEIKELRQDYNRLREEAGQLTHIVERLAFELRKDRESADREREIQQLRLENILLRFDRGLPPGNSPGEEK
jgi:predicted RNase H-like nuclease (RuvC/YqgF family)